MLKRGNGQKLVFGKGHRLGRKFASLNTTNQCYAFRNLCFIHCGFVVSVRASGFAFILALHLHEVEKSVAWRFSELVFVFEDEKRPNRHGAGWACGRLVELEGVLDGAKQKFKIAVREPGLF